MNNYICINNQKIELTQDQVDRIIAAHGKKGIPLAGVMVSDIVKIGGHEMVVLEQTGDATVRSNESWKTISSRSTLYGKETMFSPRVCLPCLSMASMATTSSKCAPQSKMLKHILSTIKKEKKYGYQFIN